MADRRKFLTVCASAGLTGTFAEALWKQLHAGEVDAAGESLAYLNSLPITRDAIRAAESLVGVSYTDAEREMMVAVLDSYLKSYRALRDVPLTNKTSPATRFSAILPGRVYKGSRRAAAVPPTSRPAATRPSSNADLAFLNVVQLAELVRTRQVTSTELTNLYLRRLRLYDPQLHCVINYTAERALRQAAQADREIAAGGYRGPLHGIPYGVKDTMAVAGYPTTWGTAAFRDRVIGSTATVVRRLDAAGAVLLAKLSMGELGLSDRWFGGRTMSPWQPEDGAKGSSSGSAAAVAAGLVPFAMGQETMGSIIVPATRNGVTALRPTFGRVSRTGSLILSWTLDKIGPMARSVEDCAVVLEAIAGPGTDHQDPTVESIPYAWDPTRPLASVKVGYYRAAFDAQRTNSESAVLDQLSALGVGLESVDFPDDLPTNALLFVRVEAVAALDEVTRTNGLKVLTEQHEEAWPNFIRSGRFVPAFEYLQANRIRTVLIERMDAVFQNVDVVVAPTQSVLNLTNLTGHPCLVAPSGFTPQGAPLSISFVGKPFGEAELCTVARAWQGSTVWNRMHPQPYATT